MFAGIMMTAMHKTMEGHGGLKGWQWVFLIGMLCTPVFSSTVMSLNKHAPRWPHGNTNRSFRFRKSTGLCALAFYALTCKKFTFPDLPENTKVSYLSRQEVEFAMNRLPPKKEDTHNIEFKSLAKRLLISPTM